MEEILNKTIFIIDDNKIYFDFPHFKLFAKPELYSIIITHIVQCIHKVLNNFSLLELHINLRTFNTASLHTYKDFITIFANITELLNDTKTLELYIYHTPSIIDYLINIIQTLFKSKKYTPKIIYYSKKESPSLLETLMTTHRDDSEVDEDDEILSNKCRQEVS